MIWSRLLQLRRTMPLTPVYPCTTVHTLRWTTHVHETTHDTSHGHAVTRSHRRCAEHSTAWGGRSARPCGGHRRRVRPMRRRQTAAQSRSRSRGRSHNSTSSSMCGVGLECVPCGSNVNRPPASTRRSAPHALHQSAWWRPPTPWQSSSCAVMAAAAPPQQAQRVAQSWTLVACVCSTLPRAATR
jgi:hypothetical protein